MSNELRGAAAPAGTAPVPAARPPAPAPVPAGRSRATARRLRQLTGFLFVVPAVVLFCGFVGYPFIRSIYISMTRWSGIGAPQFVGTRNFTAVVHDPVFWVALRQTLLFVGVTTVIQTVLPLGLAALLSGRTRRAGALRTIFFLPHVISLTTAGIIWQNLYDPNFGAFNRILGAVGLGGLRQNWLAQDHTVLWSIAMVAIWGGIGYYLIIYVAALQGISPAVYEAGRVDGANRWHEFRYLTVPLLRPATAIVLTLNLINGLKTFEVVYVMSGGGPNHASEMLSTQMYNVAFGSAVGGVPSFGYATTIGLVIMLLAVAAAVVQMLVGRRARDGR
ncbi:carbohydrate ABC transporter permease [Dactylosporangium sp. CA-092794]|uniref:carbohydrate ABC transporter permease n=1 Tax=Dactylosporangium sp. CA-092794 TaxID=3239929 RepID=UPI003D9102C5